MPRLMFVKSARKAKPEHGIAVGDSYYWASFRVGRSSFKRYWKERPKRSQLTLSSFYAQVYDIEDALDFSAETAEDLEGIRDSLVSDLEALKEECESSLENMPEGLRESSDSGTRLQERIDALDETISSYQDIDLDYDEPDDDEVKDALMVGEEPTEENMAAQRTTMLGEWLSDKQQELESVDFRYE